MTQLGDDAKPTMVLPVYNGRARIGEVLEALAAQRCDPGSFRVIVVDNNSTDGTADYARGHPAFAKLAALGNTPRVIHEARQGSAAARLAGVQAADTDIICFLDDDNVPRPDFVTRGIAFFAEHPDAALIVSRVHVVFEETPTRAVSRRRHLFASTEYMGDKVIAFGPGVAPTVTAGLWLRRKAYLAAMPREPERMVPGRSGSSLACGEDIEIGILFDRAGFRRYYDPGLSIDHKIPRGRLRVRYFTRLIEGIVRSQATLDEVYDKRRSGLRRLLDASKVAGALMAAPALIVTREDGLREALFVVVARIAAARGAYPELRDQMLAANQRRS